MLTSNVSGGNGDSSRILNSHSKLVKSRNLRWIGKIRALPSTGTNEMLKPEYLNSNLDNSRKLIMNVNALSLESNELSKDLSSHIRKPLLRLEKVDYQLAWLKPQVSPVMHENSTRTDHD